MAYVGPGFDGLIQLTLVYIYVADVELCSCVGFGVIVMAYVGPGFDGLIQLALVYIYVADVELCLCVGFGIIVAVDV